MKKIVVCLVVLMAVVFIASGAMAASVVSSRHNLSSGGTFSYRANTNEVCVFCHTPHSASSTDHPLWNRTTSSAGFQLYGTTQAGNYISGTPSSITILCFSCHDGTSGLNVMLNYPGSGTSPLTMLSGNPTLVGSYAAFDKDLSNDHPVGITYRLAGAAADLNAIGTPVAGQPVTKVTGSTAGALSGDSTTSTVECSSCHNPHDNANGSFLRASNSGSALCLVCHIK